MVLMLELVLKDIPQLRLNVWLVCSFCRPVSNFLGCVWLCLVLVYNAVHQCAVDTPPAHNLSPLYVLEAAECWL